MKEEAHDWQRGRKRGLYGGAPSTGREERGREYGEGKQEGVALPFIEGQESRWYREVRAAHRAQTAQSASKAGGAGRGSMWLGPGAEEVGTGRKRLEVGGDGEICGTMRAGFVEPMGRNQDRRKKKKKENTKK